MPTIHNHRLLDVTTRKKFKTVVAAADSLYPNKPYDSVQVKDKQGDELPSATLEHLSRKLEGKRISVVELNDASIHLIWLQAKPPKWG